ncbi:hypothetical protein B0H65DRAFT_444731 [Neurospora tetraspora]|uniref:Uncharacterized protein n=1 Tax=Neurospora tetraspora TaxID=94610 RepID=A0AAE0MQE9_9PEZI|nr:hypothetical protein B0H65DRAFT_444731 [Neurospora tetraspora]
MLNSGDRHHHHYTTLHYLELSRLRSVLPRTAQQQDRRSEQYPILVYLSAVTVTIFSIPITPEPESFITVTLACEDDGATSTSIKRIDQNHQGIYYTPQLAHRASIQKPQTSIPDP